MLRTLLIAAAFSSTVMAADTPRETAPVPRKGFDLTGYKTVKELTPADPKLMKTTGSAFNKPAGYLGVELGDKQPGVVLKDVDAESPAATAGLKAGDLVLSIDGTEIKTLAQARDSLKGHSADEVLAIRVERGGKEKLELKVTLKPISKPFSSTSSRAVMGVTMSTREGRENEVRVVTTGSAADKAGLKVDDLILKIDDKAVETGISLTDILSDRKPGDEVTVTYKRGKDEKTVKVKLTEEARTTFGGGGWDDRLPRAWTGSKYKLAIIGVEYPDQKHNEKITDEAWNASMFSNGTYTGKSVTGQKVHGSLADYYKEISYGKLKVEGKFVGWVEMSKKKMEYSTGSGVSGREKTSYFTEAMDKFLAKNGKNALDGYDGIFFLYAGPRIGTSTRGSLYWPHRSSFRHNNKNWPYFIVQEGGDTMTNISVFCHEFGHMLGLPDLYARPEVPGMEGVGVWCAMSQQRPNGQPQHFSAWSKEQLNWIKPTIIDPRIKQKIVLAPIEDDNTQCLKVVVRTDGSEYFLVENRQRKGFDSSLPADGLLIWRVIPGNGIQKVYLEESHGIEGSTGPRVFPGAVPFPSPANTAFTPYTTPSSKSLVGGGFDVHITNIKRLSDGRVALTIGYEYQ